MIRVFVPRATRPPWPSVPKPVATLLAAQPGVEVVRNGSRGMFWLEPMVEVETEAGRIAYGPVEAGDVRGLLEAGLLRGGAHPLRLGRPEEIPFLARQTRLTFARCGITDPPQPAGLPRPWAGWPGLARARALGPAATVEEVFKSGPARAWRGGVPRPASSGAPVAAAPADRRDTSSATRMRGIAGRSPTAW